MSAVIPLSLTAHQHKQLARGHAITISHRGSHKKQRVVHVEMDHRMHRQLMNAMKKGRGKRIHGRIAHGGNIFDSIGHAFKGVTRSVGHAISDTANRTGRAIQGAIDSNTSPAMRRLADKAKNGIVAANDYAIASPVLHPLIKYGAPILAGTAADAGATFLTGNPYAGYVAGQAASRGTNQGLTAAGYGLKRRRIKGGSLLGKDHAYRMLQQGHMSYQPRLTGPQLATGTDQVSGNFLLRNSGTVPHFQGVVNPLYKASGHGFTPIGSGFVPMGSNRY